MKNLFAASVFALMSGLPALASPQFECVSAIGVAGPGVGQLYQGPILNQVGAAAVARVPGYDLSYYMEDRNNGVLSLNTGSNALNLDTDTEGVISSTGFLGTTSIVPNVSHPSTCQINVFAVACGQTAELAQAGLSILVNGLAINPSTDLPFGCTTGKKTKPKGTSK